tara:strand:+ start:247 stop:354 length:108 start_codon:yes stop_codon:yes gene_type:complete
MKRINIHDKIFIAGANGMVGQAKKGYLLNMDIKIF